jgi:hypothetical protein
VSARKPEPRTAIGPDGHRYVSVTSAMALVKTILGEPPDSYGPPALARVHAMEGTACHAACLDWLAHRFGWLPDYQAPAWIPEHGDERRWVNVLHAAQKGFQEFVEQHEVEPIGIEQESFSKAYGLVGHLDLYCSMKRKRHRIKTVVDLKFVAALQASHRLQVRTYGRLDGFKDTSLGLLYHGNRNTGIWKIEEVDLTLGLEDVAAVANAAHLFNWAESKKSL